MVERLPYGCMTGLAKEITFAIEECAISQKAKLLMACITSDAMGNAGLETEHPEEAGLWCDMDTATWAVRMKCSKPYIGRLTEQLIGLGLVTRHPAPKVSSDNWQRIVSCRLRFNPDLEDWQPRKGEAHTERYSKPGAGRPRKNTSERDTPDKNKLPTVIHQISDSQSALTESGLGQGQGGGNRGEDTSALTIRNISDVSRPVAKNQSHVSRLPAQKIISRVTHGSSESRAGDAPRAPLRKVTKEEREEVRMLAAHAAQEQMFPSEVEPEAKAKKAHKPDTLWDTAVALFHQPMGGELKDWRYNIVPELRKQGITPEQLQQAAQRYKSKWPNMNYSLKAVFNHLGDLLKAATPATQGAASLYSYDLPAYMKPKGAN